MGRRNNSTFSRGETPGKHEHPLPQEITKSERNASDNAFEEAMNDIDHDPEFSTSNPNDDLDEGESARLGEDNTDLI